MFIEIGSNEKEWIDKSAADIIAKTIIKTITEYKKKDYEEAIGFGGTHYCQNFNEIELSSSIAMSHICPKYHIENLDEDTIKKMLDSSDLPVKLALIDWKGISGAEKQKLIIILEKMGIAWKKTKDI
jgi:D-aminoacyl-tRNA deacylase